MPVFEGDDQDNTIFGSDGDDTLNGGNGIDTAVFTGDLADFVIDDIGSDNDPNQITVTDTESGVVDVLNDIEFLSFDDGVVSVLDFIDDFGETPDTGGEVKLQPLVVAQPFGLKDLKAVPEQRSVGSQIGSFDASGDIDGFSVVLEAGRTYQISAERVEISPGILDIAFFTTSIDEDLEILNVFDPNEILIDGTDDTGSDLVTFTAIESGDHFFTLAGLDDTTGNYEVTVEELRLNGTSFNEDLKGTNGDDTLNGGGGEDFIDGSGGVDVVVFDGIGDNFFVTTELPDLNLDLVIGNSVATSGVFGEEDTETVFVRDGRTNEVTELVNVETLRFDDGDVSILEFIDDFGDTADTAGAFFELPDPTLGGTDFTVKGRIDAIGDVDAFTVELDAGETFAIQLFAPGFADGNTITSPPFIVQSILDPEGNDALRAATPEELRETISVVEFFRATQSGTYLFSFAGAVDNIGDYRFDLGELPSIGDDTANSFFVSPFDDVIDAQGGDDFIFVAARGGTDFIDGGDDEDTLIVLKDISDFQFSVSADGEVIKTDAAGNVTTIVNVENFEFNLGAEVFTLDELQAFSELVDAGDAFTVQVGDDDADALTGGLGNDIYQGGGGDDVIIDAGGTNNVDGGEGADIIAFVSGTNTVDGGTEGDLIIGGFGNDNLAGGAGNDVIVGDISTTLSGTDRITGGTGDDLLEGRGGQDTFVFTTDDGTDTIGALDVDFDDPSDTTVTGADFVSGLDLIELNGFAFADQDAAFANVTDVDGVATFSDQGTTIIFDGLTTADLSSDDFILV